MKSAAFGASLAVAHGNTEARGKTTFSTRDREKSQAKPGDMDWKWVEQWSSGWWFIVVYSGW